MRTLILIALWCSCAAAWAQTDPLVLYPTDDTYLTHDHTGIPGDRATRDEFQIYGKANGQQFRALLKFDLEKIKVPPTQAILRLYGWNIGRPNATETIRCHRLMRAWSEKFASWDKCLEDDGWANLGGDWDPRAVAGCQVTVNHGGQKGFWFDFDVTPLVQAWIAKQVPNYGVVLMLDEGDSAEVRVRSKDAGSNKPELKLAWRGKIELGSGMVPGHKLKPYGKVVPTEPVFATDALNMVKVGAAFKQQLAARAGARPYTFSATGLPEGVTLSESGELAGTLAKAGRWPITVVCQGADRKRATARLELVAQEDAPATAEAKNVLDLTEAGLGKDAGAKKDPAKPKTPEFEEEEE